MLSSKILSCTKTKTVAWNRRPPTVSYYPRMRAPKESEAKWVVHPEAGQQRVRMLTVEEVRELANRRMNEVIIIGNSEKVKSLLVQAVSKTLFDITVGAPYFGLSEGQYSVQKLENKVQLFCKASGAIPEALKKEWEDKFNTVIGEVIADHLKENSGSNNLNPIQPLKILKKK